MASGRNRSDGAVAMLTGKGPGKTPSLSISYTQDFANTPMDVTLTQTKKGGHIVRGTFTIDAKAALRLVAMLAPLAGRALDKEAV